MRLCGVDENYITGGASYKEKFVKYAQIMPLLAGNPLYYFSHFELKQLFDITEPLDGDSAEYIYEKANEILASYSVADFLKKYKVELVATTDDPADTLQYHGIVGKTAVVPTFRPDKYYCPSDSDLARLGTAAEVEIKTLDDLLSALVNRLDFFVEKGCFMSDHGFEKFPRDIISKEEADKLFDRRKELDNNSKNALFGYILRYLLKEYKKRGMTAQLHFSVRRNVNSAMFAKTGVDSGFDVAGEPESPAVIEIFLNSMDDSERPDIILYALNDTPLKAIASITGAFRGVRMGAAWWFNDTVSGIRRNLDAIAEYSALGTSPGMLTDSRSFAGYSRFDFFRRILCDYVGNLVDRGEYSEKNAEKLVYDICYDNARKMANNSVIYKKLTEGKA
jgi:glucuronate isomerase